jgi:hypothetical protein
MHNQGANGRLSAAYLTVLGVYDILQLELIPACRSTQCRACAFDVRSFALIIKVGTSKRNSYAERWCCTGTRQQSVMLRAHLLGLPTSGSLTCNFRVCSAL